MQHLNVDGRRDNAKSIYKLLLVDTPRVLWRRMVWDKSIVPKLGFIVWFALRNKLRFKCWVYSIIYAQMISVFYVVMQLKQGTMSSALVLFHGRLQVKFLSSCSLVLVLVSSLLGLIGLSQLFEVDLIVLEGEGELLLP